MLRQLKRACLKAVGRCIGPEPDSGSRILGYHSVGDGESPLSISTERFRAQVDRLLADGFHLMTLRQWWDRLHRGQGELPRSVVLTFDDGFQGVARHAAAILRERGLAATVFLVTDCIGRTNAYDRPRGAPELPLMGWEEILQLKEEGWDFQSHGCTHRDLRRLDERSLERELLVSKSVLERRLGEPVEFFSYPYNVTNGRVIRAVARAGYQGAVACESGSFWAGSPLAHYHLRRIMADAFDREEDFLFRFSVGYRRLAQGRLRLLRAAHRLSGFALKDATIHNPNASEVLE